VEQQAAHEAAAVLLDDGSGRRAYLGLDIYEVPSMTEQRKLFYFESESSEDADKLILTSHKHYLVVTAESPWAGDTETGFGENVTVSLNYKQAVALENAIHSWLMEQEQT
jgi:hypothetical protein